MKECHLCRAPLDGDYYETDNGMLWCTDIIECKYRSRRRLGIPAHVNLRAKANEIQQQAMRLHDAAVRAQTRADELAERHLWQRDEEYLRHINSAWWHDFSDEQRLKARHRCEGQGCNVQGVELHVHHIVYTRFGGQERPEDVLVLCPICHMLYDDKRRNKEPLRVSIVATETRRIVQWEMA